MLLSRATAETSDRIGGKKPVYEPVGEIEGHLYVNKDRYSVENSGDHRESCYSLIVMPDKDIREKDRVTISGAEYIVRELLSYGTHKTVVLEKAGAIWQP